MAYRKTWCHAVKNQTINQLNSASSTQTDINKRLAKAWTTIDRLSVIWKSDLTDKIKRSFFQAAAAVVSILLYGCTAWTLTKRMEKKLDGNYTRMLRAILNKSWRQQSTKQQMYRPQAPITKPFKVRRTRHAWRCWRRKDELISDVIVPLRMNVQKQDDQLEPTYSSTVPIQNVALKTYWQQWTIEKGDKKRSGISLLMARHDDDDYG